MATSATGVLVPAAAASPGPGDREVRRALAAVDRLEATSDRLGAALSNADDTGIAPVVRAARALRTASARAVIGLRHTAPDTAQGRRMRRLGVEIAMLHREVARLVVAAQRAEDAGRDGRSERLLFKTLAVLLALQARAETAHEIVLPDPAAFIEAVVFVGAVTGDPTEDPASLPIRALAGGTMTRCDRTDYGVGWRHFPTGIHGASLIRVTTTAPDGSTTRSVRRIDAADEGVEVTLPVRARGDGAYRLQVTQGPRVLLDVGFTRACA